MISLASRKMGFMLPSFIFYGNEEKKGYLRFMLMQKVWRITDLFLFWRGLATVRC